MSFPRIIREEQTDVTGEQWISLLLTRYVYRHYRVPTESRLKQDIEELLLSEKTFENNCSNDMECLIIRSPIKRERTHSHLVVRPFSLCSRGDYSHSIVDGGLEEMS